MCVCVRVCIRTHTHTHTACGVFYVSPGVRRTPGELEKSKSTKALYTCRLVHVYRIHLSTYMLGCEMMIWANYCFLFSIFFLLKKEEDVTKLQLANFSDSLW